jgi:hypothetical protein
MVEQNRSGSYTQFVYSPTGVKMQFMNGQAPPTKSIVALPGGGVAAYTATGLYYAHLRSNTIATYLWDKTLGGI